MRYYHVMMSSLIFSLLLCVPEFPNVIATEQYQTIQVKKGQTLYRIAKKHHLSISSLVSLNQISNPDFLRIGQTLRIPKKAKDKEGKQSSQSKKSKNEKPKKESITTSSFSRGKFLGHFTLTAYTAGPESTGKQSSDPGYGITSSGENVIEGLTVAVDPDLIPIGSRVYIEGIGYRVAQDIGSAIQGKRIDLYISDLEKARAFGVKRNVRVELVK